MRLQRLFFLRVHGTIPYVNHRNVAAVQLKNNTPTLTQQSPPTAATLTLVQQAVLTLQLTELAALLITAQEATLILPNVVPAPAETAQEDITRAIAPQLLEDYQSEPSRQVRILPGLGKVHVVHTYDRIVPYVGHKRLNVVTSSPIVVRVRPSTLYREYDRIENKVRPFSYHSYTNDYLNSESHVRIVYVRNPISSSYPVYKASTLYSTRYYPTYGSYLYYPTYLNSYYYSYPLTRRYHTYNFYPSLRWYDLALFPSWRYNHYARMFDDETRNIRAQTASILQRIHDPVPRKIRSLPLPYVSRFDNYDDKYSGTLCRYQEMPARLSNDHYINRMLLSSPSSKSQYTVYSSEPVRKYFGQGHLACVSMVGEKSHPRRRNVYAYQDPVRNDIQLLSYYINRFREEKALSKPIKADANVEEQPQKPQAEIIILSASRPSRIFSVPRPLEGVVQSEESDDFQKLKQDRSSRLAKIMVIDEDIIKAEASAKVAEERIKSAQKKEEEMKKAAERAAKKEESKSKKSILATIESELSVKDAEATAVAKKVEEEAAAKKAAQEAAAKKVAEEAAAKKAAEEEAARKTAEEAAARKVAEEEAAQKAAKEEAARMKAEEEAAAAKRKAEEEAAKKEKEAQEAAEKAAELERLAEQARQDELAKQAEIEQAKKEEEERARLEEEKRLAEAAKAEEEKQQLLRLEEIARQAEEEKEAELARQADELAELARQEAEIAEQTKLEEEAVEEQRKEADHAEIEKKEAELAELEQKEKELSELAKQEAEVAEQARIEAEQAKIEAVNIEVNEEEVAVEDETPIVEEPETPEEMVPEAPQEPAEEVQE